MAVHGEKAWMWIQASEKETVYVAAELRGKGIAKEIYGDSQADAMTDGLASYTNTIPKDKHSYCWSHVLRFAYEETVKSPKESLAVFLRDKLVRIYRMKREHPEYTKEQLETLLREEFKKLLTVSSQEEAIINIHNRVKDQQEGLIHALLTTKDGTNNLAERELRNMAIKRTVSNGSDTFTGMETTAVIGSVIQSLTRDKGKAFLPTLKTYMRDGVQEKYGQYMHIPNYDSNLL